MLKHQSNCYRIYRGVELFNYCDLEFSAEENERMIAEAKAKFKVVRKERVKVDRNSSSFYRLFVSLNNLKQ